MGHHGIYNYFLQVATYLQGSEFTRIYYPGGIWQRFGLFQPIYTHYDSQHNSQ